MLTPSPAFSNTKYGHVIFEILFLDSFEQQCLFFSALFKDLIMPIEV